MTEWIPAGLTPGTTGERVYAATSEAEARAAIGAAAADDPRLDGALQAEANLGDLPDPAAALAALGGAKADLTDVAVTGAAEVPVLGDGYLRLGSNLPAFVEVSAAGVKLPALYFRGGKRHEQGTAAPTSGNFAVGDVVENTSPAVGGAWGWVCVAAGTPGTWIEMGGSSGRAVKVLDFIPPSLHSEVIAGGHIGDVTAHVQAAIATGKDVDLQGLTIHAAGLVMPNSQQCLFSSAGVANIFKSADGPILTVSGSDVTLRHVVFRGQSSAHTGHNIHITGNRPRLEFCGSLDAEGRAVFAPADKVQIFGYTYGYQTADVSTTGYDIEIGHSNAATLYHQIIGTYGGAHGGILLINSGSHSITDCLFGKLTLQNVGSPAGANGGKMSGNRILDVVSVGLSNAAFVANQFGAVTVTLENGTGGCTIDESNTWQGGSSVVNNGNGSSNYIARSIGTGAYPYNGQGLKFGAAVDAIEIVYRNGQGMWCNWNYLLSNGRALKSRNSANTADLHLMSMSQVGDSVFVGHGSGTGNTVIDSGSGGVRLASTGSAIIDVAPTVVKPNVDNAVDLGTAALRFKVGHSYVFDAATEYRISGSKVVGARLTGWVPATGVANKAAYTTYAAGSASGTYAQAELQGVMNNLQSATERVKALEDAMRTHGLID